MGRCACACAIAATGGACTPRTVVVDQAVQVYVPLACGDAGGSPVTYTGLGDFQPTSDPTETVPLGTAGFALAQLSPDTREVVVGPVTDAGPWAGAALIAGTGDLSVLLLPESRACHLSLSVDVDGNAGATFGMLDATHAMLVGGAIPPFVVDLGTGVVAQLALGVAPPRNYASVTSFGAGALIAGGEDPTRQNEVQETATVYTPGAASAGSPIVLMAGQREKHAGVVLPDGRTLLVGGVTQAGSLVTQVEAVDPSDATQSSVVATLASGRANPTVLLLPTGQLFVGGGFDASGTPVRSMEWFSLPGLVSLGSADLCGAGAEQGFAVTEEGAVLAVMGPAKGTSACSNVHLVLPPRGSAPPTVMEAPVLDPPPAHVHLFQGAEAEPLLVTDTSTFRWDAWAGSFASLGPDAAGLSLPTAAFLSASPGLALWLGEDDHVWALRFDTRGPYATDFVHPSYLDTDDLFTAPDRLAGADVSFSVASGASLTNGASIFLTDATYAGVTVTVQLPTGGAVDVVLRDPAGSEVVCAATGVPAAGSVTVVRSGPAVTLSVGGGAPASCFAGATTLDGNARVAVGLRAAAAGTSVVRGLTVTR